jgi:hypothetical protein
MKISKRGEYALRALRVTAEANGMRLDSEMIAGVLFLNHIWPFRGRIQGSMHILAIVLGHHEWKGAQVIALFPGQFSTGKLDPALGHIAQFVQRTVVCSPRVVVALDYRASCGLSQITDRPQGLGLDVYRVPEGATEVWRRATCARASTACMPW